MIFECTAIGFGVGCVIWGTRRILEGEDFDEEKVLSEIPAFVRDHVRKVEVTPTGNIRFHLQTGAPDIAEREIRQNVDVEEDGEVEVERDDSA